MSKGRIKTGIYHAEIRDKRKDELHEKWRLGEVKVMCATIGISTPLIWICTRLTLYHMSSSAFGLGIDKKDVRFVLHHSVRPLKSGF
jgi:ATP-dependent DNA helicase Q1